MTEKMTDKINVQDLPKLGLLTLPGVLVSLLPSLACPLCWPAYAALVSSLGLGFLASSTYLLPLTGVLLALALAIVGLGLQAKNKGYGPLALALVSAGAILPGKFLLASAAMTYAGVALLVIASAWSMLPARAAGSASCTTCARPGEGEHQSV
jgi:mercuric ion transport protein